MHTYYSAFFIHCQLEQQFYTDLINKFNSDELMTLVFNEVHFYRA